MAKYAIGLDYGTLSGRALLVDIFDGREIATSVFEYPHAVMDEELPCGKKLGRDWALQHPQDYIDVLANTVPAVINESGVNPEDIIGLGIDFTACTMLPVKADSTPLCFLPEYEENPHAYVKLWKHHAAQEHANKLNKIARELNVDWLDTFGGKISSEWLIPKIWQILDEAPDIYEKADKFIEAGDWVVWKLCGKETRNACCAGYKALWNKKNGYPPKSFFKALDPRLENVAEEKLGPVTPLGEKAGEVTEEMAALTGLKPGTAVAIATVDAHVAVPAVGITGEGELLAIMGTSTCHILLGNEEKQVPGMCGVVEDGVMPGYFGFEAGQCCVGDSFQWYIENCLPQSIFKEAEEKGVNIHKLLREKCSKQKPGESGLLALDWFNGNRSVLCDVDLSGMILGLTIGTKPEEIYRALIESTAYGTRMIVDTFKENGVEVKTFYAAGGISQKDPMTMQIYSDVLNVPVKIAGTTQCGSLGSAIFGAVAAGAANGGYDDVFEAAKVMGKVKDTVYYPIEENVKIYDKIYAEYKTLHDYFGRGENNVMKRLKKIALEG